MRLRELLNRLQAAGFIVHEPPEPDCLLCAGKATPHAGTLLGMDVCLNCSRRYLPVMQANTLRRDVMEWATLVLRIRMEHRLQKWPLRVATRMALAERMGLKVDPEDLAFLEPELRPWRCGC